MGTFTKLLTEARLYSTVPSERIADELEKTDVIRAWWVVILRTWYLAGAKVYNLTDGLTAGLMLTTIPGAEWPESVPPPHSSFILQIPEGYLRAHQGGGWTRFLSVSVITHEGGFRVGVMCSDTIETGASSCDVVFVFPVARNRVDRLLPVNMEGSATDIPSHVVRDGQGVVRRIVVGFCSWLASLNESLGTRGTTGVRRGGPVDRAEVIVAGREVKLPSEMRQAAKDLSAAAHRHGSPTPQWKLRFKHVVRGHWRLQACGPRLSQHKLVWIAPYWKGPDGAMAWQHVVTAGLRPENSG